MAYNLLNSHFPNRRQQIKVFSLLKTEAKAQYLNRYYYTIQKIVNETGSKIFFKEGFNIQVRNKV